MPLKRLALAAALAGCAALPADALAQEPPPPPPENDHYLQSFRVNDPGDRLPRRTTTRFVTDTTSATVQQDLFNPLSDGTPGSGGPVEPTICNLQDGPHEYGNTVWYDIYPDRPVIARVTVNALFNPVIGILPFNVRTAQPDLRNGLCVDRLAFTQEEMSLNLRRGGAYTVQVGGRDATGGGAEVLFDFFTPATVRANSNLRATRTRRGIRVRRLTVNAPRGSRIDVRCSRRQCRRQVRRAMNEGLPEGFGRPSAAGARASSTGAAAGAAATSPRANAARTLSFRRVRREIRRGAKIDIRVTQSGRIGRFIRYTVTRRGFKRTERCMDPGSTRPRRSCG